MPSGVYKRTVKHGKAISVGMTGNPNVIAARIKDWQNPEIRDNHIVAKIGVSLSPEHKAAIAAGNKDVPKSPKHVVALIEGHNTLEALKNHSVASIENWKNPVYIAKLIKSLHTFPNKPEKFLTQLFNKLFPDRIKYTGSGGNPNFIIGGRNPDFMFIDGQKKIIEFNGDYHHGPKKTSRTNAEEEQRQIKHYDKHGYQTLVIWERELKDIETMCKRVTEFVVGAEPIFLRS